MSAPNTPSSPVVGRFAPSPTGALHFGSALTALASYLNVRRQHGRWLLRIEDVDVTRAQPGAADNMLRSLEQLGLEWDAQPIWQSRRTEAYRAAFEILKSRELVYPCACTRAQLQEAPLTRDGSRRYPGTCRSKPPPHNSTTLAWRLRTTDDMIAFEDAIQGKQYERLVLESGDFVLLRSDGLFAYQLAVVVDDAESGVTEVVRGADLLDSTCRQRYLQQCLDYPALHYAHVPLAVNAQGEKLSKQTLAQPIATFSPNHTLWTALQFLGQNPPEGLSHAPVRELLTWGEENWRLDTVPRVRTQLTPSVHPQRPLGEHS